METTELTLEDITCFRTLVRQCLSFEQIFDLSLTKDGWDLSVYQEAENETNELVTTQIAKCGAGSIADVVKIFFKVERDLQ